MADDRDRPRERLVRLVPEQRLADSTGFVELVLALHKGSDRPLPELGVADRDLAEASHAAARRLGDELTDEQKDDVAIVAARIQAQATVDAAEIGRKATVRAAVIAFFGTLVGAAIGAGASNWLYDLVTATP